MNSKWQGAEWTLAERYSDYMKNVFFILFYSVILPSLYFLITLTLVNTYLVDKYSLYRLWKRKPANGEMIGKISRHFFTFAVLTHIIMAIFFFSNWPKYSICDHTEPMPKVYFRIDYRYSSHLLSPSDLFFSVLPLISMPHSLSYTQLSS
jgi:hypothetical protein